MTKYSTKHRRKIKEFFKDNSHQNYTVAETRSQLNQEGYSIGIATLYRQLAALNKEGYLSRVQDGGVDRYYYSARQEDCHQHYHLKCLGCGRLIHLDCSFLEGLEDHMLEHHNFIISRGESTLYGRCSQCEGR